MRRRFQILVACALLLVGGIIAAELTGRGESQQAQTAALEATTTGASEATAADSGAISRQDEEGCSSGIYGHAVEVTIYGGSCDEWDRNQSSSGNFWRPIQLREEPVICSRSKGSMLIEVRDEYGAEYGTSICADLTAKGWTETPGPGVEHEEDHRRAEAQARQRLEENEARERAVRDRESERETHKQATEQRELEAQQHRQETQERAQAQREQTHAEEEQRQAEAEAQRGNG